jgi:CSLREA domain-containing protein
MRAPRHGSIGSLCLFAVAAAFGSAALGATITVNSTADTQSNDGKCTLREAILSANTDSASGAAAGECAAGSGTDAIHFAIPGSDSGCNASGICTIAPTSALPVVGDGVTFDGYTQPGASVNTLAQGTNAVLKIVLSGASGAGNGLNLGSSVTVRGLVINGCDHGIVGLGVDGDKVIGCFIGVNASGSAAVANNTGIDFEFGGTNHTIGGTALADRNLISGNYGRAILLASIVGSTIQGNLIGTNAAGTAAIPNGNDNNQAISVLHAGLPNDCLIGGTAAGAGNLISGNKGGGITTLGTTVTIQGNFIGTNAAGTGPLGNGFEGVSVNGEAKVGGTTAGEGNVIAYNNAIATGAFGYGAVSAAAGTTGVTVRGNSIHDNAGSGAHAFGLGIDMGAAGVTINDPGDTELPFAQNFPEITAVTASSVSGTLNSAANAAFDLDFYASPTCSPSGYGEGQTYLGSKTVTTNASGNISFIASVTVPAGQMVTATATAADGSTSEFSRCTNLVPAFVDADPSSGATSDGNGVLEPGETATIRANWTNPTAVSFPPFTSTASALSGPSGASYSIVDSADDYGQIYPKTTGSCVATGNCFTMFVSDPATRPVTHWDASFTETLSSTRDGAHSWKLHLGDSFADVPRTQLFYKKIETVFHNAITVGCDTTHYCPNAFVARDQMAIFIARAIAHGGANVPTSGSVGGKAYNCTAGGVSLYTDVAPTSIACKSIHYIAAQNVTTGCNPSLYCPTQLVTRAQMAIFVAKGMVAPAGGGGVPLVYTDPLPPHLSFSCDAAGTPHSYFTDVTPADAFCKHVNFLYLKNVIAGCSASQYCPNENVTRGEMAKFLGNAFTLQLYGP